MLLSPRDNLPNFRRVYLLELLWNFKELINYFNVFATLNC